MSKIFLKPSEQKPKKSSVIFQICGEGSKSDCLVFSKVLLNEKKVEGKIISRKFKNRITINMAKKSISGVKVAAGVGAGLAALAAATAGAYFLYGKDGAKNKKKIKSWMLKAKGEVLDQIEKMKDVSEEAYTGAIDKVSQKYKAVKNIDPAELDQMIKELKGHWKSIKKQIVPPAKKKTAAKKK